MTLNVNANMKKESVIHFQDNFVYEIQISRADKMNALTNDMYASLVAALQRAENNDGIKVIFLRSNNENFCAGNDLADFLNVEFTKDSPVVQFLHLLANLKKPLICAIGGATIGIGTTLLLHCDLVFASKTTQFSMPFIKLGLTPEGGSSQLLSQQCGRLKANDWLLTGRTFFVDEALQAGLVNDVFDDLESTWQHAKKTALDLSKSSLKLLIETKKLLNVESAKTINQVIDNEVDVFIEALQTPECKAILNNFLTR